MDELPFAIPASVLVQKRVSLHVRRPTLEGTRYPSRETMANTALGPSGLEEVSSWFPSKR